MPFDTPSPSRESRTGRPVNGAKNTRRASRVTVSSTSIALPTYLPAAPDKNPMFLEKRVYQGSSGRIYPLPFTDRIAEQAVEREWKAVWIENEFLRAMVLPELGGRIHILQDKTNGCDLVYNQPVIKPALVGLAGPWISGGIEFNWPQHHRPATFLPVDIHIENGADGSRTVWCSDHDPMTRMKGMHGVCLHPGRAYLELKVRAYNRTPFVQTFLWWANVATRVHEAYQSFFPPDVHYVADHARRSMTAYPLADGYYYGINYGGRDRHGIPRDEQPRQFVPPHGAGLKAKRGAPDSPHYAANDLSFYANIPVPTSYMCLGSRADFFGGYDHAARAGIIHIASHHISPGKKQWTWGNHEFGYAWDRQLTVGNQAGTCDPYIEIMAGVYTDNQPDFSFLQTGETKTWSQYWYPIRETGPATQANLDAAVSLQIPDRPRKRAAAGLSLAVSVTREFPGAILAVLLNGKPLWTGAADLTPSRTFAQKIKMPAGARATDLRLRISDAAGAEIIVCQPQPRGAGPAPAPATEPPPPGDIPGADELFITGLHLEQYRHATRCPTLYWREALRRDPLDSRSNNALGLWHLKRGEFSAAETHFRNAIARLTRRNPNPYDGEAYYNLGLCLRFQDRLDEAYDAFYKACWNQAWVAAGCHALAEIDCGRRHWTLALEHLDQSLRFNTDNLRARNLKAIALRKLKRAGAAAELLAQTLALDPLDWWARYLRGDRLDCDTQTRLDVVHDLARAGLFLEANGVLSASARADSKILPDQSWGAGPMARYTQGWLLEKRGHPEAARTCYLRASILDPDYCFPARLEEIPILESAMRLNPRDSRAPYYLGNLLYDRRRHGEAIKLWERSAELDPHFSVVWRNLGIGYFNILKDYPAARAAYDAAFRANPADARLVHERDQLWKRLRETPARRLRELEMHPDLVRQRDDLSVEFGSLLNQTGRHREAMELLAGRNFQPWEGGEGGPLGLHVRTRQALGRQRLAAGDFPAAAKHFTAALKSPENLGEARHALANQSDIHYWLGEALDRLGRKKAARQYWRNAASFKGDFQEMSVRTFSEMTYFSGLAWQKLGQGAKAKRLFQELLAYARNLRKSRAKIDYFATSLPTMLIFEDDLQYRQTTSALLLEAQARLGLGQKSRARKLLLTVLRRDPNSHLAADLLTRYPDSQSLP